MTNVVKGVSSKSRFLVRFQDGCDKDLISNKLTVVIVDKTPMTKESGVSIIYTTPDETVDLEKGYYHDIYVLLQFNT